LALNSPLLLFVSDRCFHFLILQNSNLVLTAEQRTAVGKEPDGSAQSLWGKMAGRMGDRVERARPEGAEQRRSSKKRDSGEEQGFNVPKKRRVSCY
jgi:pre-mRNA-splicing helicase BRR2